ncbi:MAG: hypothetical protein HDT39_14840 [Lachnospiraceae bacterium]|nr:hypothetical protein [Lachnospiraceae bacterium]
MKWFSSLLKRRKQDDRIKIILFFALLGIIFLGNSVYRIVKLYNMVSDFEEYVLTENETIIIKDIQINALSKFENVISISRQKEVPLELKKNSESISLNCLKLSESYLKTVYGININSSMKVFFINKSAYSMMTQSQDFAEEFKKGKDSIMADFVLGEESESYGTAKVVLVEDKVPDDMPLAFCKAESSDFGNDSSGVRVMFANGDLTSANEEILKSMGFTISDNNESDRRTLLYEKEFLHIKYSGLTAGLCFLFMILHYFGTMWYNNCRL